MNFDIIIQMNSILYQDIYNLLSSYLKIIILIEMTNITYVVYCVWSLKWNVF